MVEQNLVPFEPEALECGSCGGRSVRTEMIVEEFDYGVGPNPARLSAVVPLRTCTECDFQFTDHFGEAARHDAVCRHLGVMTPREVESVRVRLRLSRAAFAEVTKLGEASLSRWEKGLLIQNAANDQLLYLMTLPGNLGALRMRDTQLPGRTRPRPVFRRIPDPDRRQPEAERFHLRLSASF